MTEKNYLALIRPIYKSRKNRFLFYLDFLSFLVCMNTSFTFDDESSGILKKIIGL